MHQRLTLQFSCPTHLLPSDLGLTQEIVQKQMIETYPERLSLKYYEGIVVQLYNEEKKMHPDFKSCFFTTAIC